MEVESHNDNQTSTQPQPTGSQNQKQVSKRNPSNRRTNYFQLFACPFVNYKPAEIEDFAYRDGLLAAARNNCSIDIYSYPSWAHIHTIRCDEDTPIKKVLWVKNGDETVLLVAFVNCMLSVYSLKDVSPIVTKVVTGNAIWDIATSQFREEIAIACDNGSTMIYKYEGEDDLYLHKSLRTFQERALSIAYDSNYQNKNVLYVGYEKGAIRKFDLATGNVLITINLANTDLIWKVLSVRQDDTLVVASSQGVISFFETKYGTLRSELKTHEADILCLESNDKTGIIYATGLDSKVVTLEKITATKGGVESWVVSSTDRGQSHDIKALKLIEDDVLISGGVTTDICLYKLNKGRFIERKGILLEKGSKDIKLRHITDLPNSRVMSVSASKNIIVLAKDFGVEIWKYDIDKMEYNFLVEVKVKSSPIISFAITNNAKYFAYSTLEETVLYKLFVKKVQIEKIATYSASSCMIFNHSGNRLFRVSLESVLYAHDIEKDKVRELAKLPGDYKGQYTDIELAHTREVVAVGSKVGKSIHVFDCENSAQENALETIPDLMTGEHYTCFKFGMNPDQLIIVYESNKFVAYHWKEKVLTKWSRENQKRLPANFLKKYNKIVGIVCNPQNPSQIILYTNYYYIRVHFTEPVPRRSEVIKPGDELKKPKEKIQEEKPEVEGEKTKKKNKGEFTNFQIVYRKNPILQFEMLKDGKMLCLETSWKDFTATLPGAVNAKKYGL